MLSQAFCAEMELVDFTEHYRHFFVAKFTTTTRRFFLSRPYGYDYSSIGLQSLRLEVIANRHQQRSHSENRCSQTYEIAVGMFPQGGGQEANSHERCDRARSDQPIAQP